MLFQKEHLQYAHYGWPAHSATLFTGRPSRRVFDRNDGYQVMFLIHFYESLSEQFDIQKGQRVEKLLQNSLPTEVKSEAAVFNWLLQWLQVYV